MNLNLLVVDRTKEVKSWPDLQLRLVSLDNRTDNGDVYILCAYVMGRRNGCNVNVCLT